MFEICISLYNHYVHCKWRKTFERIDRTREQNKMDVGVATRNPFERK